MKTARLMITLDYHLNCELCCNKHESIKNQIKKIPNVQYLIDEGYQSVSITGGEPLTHPSLLVQVIKKLGKAGITLYLYTAYGIRVLTFGQRVAVLDYCNGISYSIHKNTPVYLQEEILQEINFLRHVEDVSIRLWVEEGVVIKDTVFYSKRIFDKFLTIGKMLPEGQCDLPEDDLFLLESSK